MNAIDTKRQTLLEEIKQSRSPQARLMAVSKQQPDHLIDDALKAGQRLFGENRVQEAIERWERRKVNIPDLELHLIGPLQTNKVKQAVALFDMIQTLDREKLAIALSEEMCRQNRPLPCLIQVNTGEEEQKGGIAPSELADFLHFCQKECRLEVRGLMCIPPAHDLPALHFAFLKKLATIHGLQELSMGMSNDYPKALALQTRYIRIGSAFFGARPIL